MWSIADMESRSLLSSFARKEQIVCDFFNIDLIDLQQFHVHFRPCTKFF